MVRLENLEPSSRRARKRRESSPWRVTGALVATAALCASTAQAAPQNIEEVLAGALPTRRFEVTSAAVERFINSPGIRVDAPEATGPAKKNAWTEEPLRFDIEPGPLGDVIEAFRTATGWEVEIANPLLAEVPSPGVVGSYTAEEALQKLLESTGVSFDLPTAGSVRLDLRISESVQVTEELRAELSSRKYTAPILDVPQTVTIVSRDVIEEQNATTLRDVLRNVSGISIQAGEGGQPAGDNLSIRGFNARTDIFVDGVRDFGGYSRDPFNFEQVEVTKGPASVYGGRGSTGGSVNLATKAPNLSSFQSGSFGLGNASYKRATFDVNQPLESLGDGVAFRLNAMWTDAETAGRDTVESSRWGVAPSLSIGTGGATRLTLGYFHLDQDNVPDYGVPWVPSNNTALAEYQNQPAPVDYNNFYGLSARDYERTLTRMATATFDHEFSSTLTFTNLFRFGVTDRDSVITSPRFASTDSTDIRRTDMKSRDQDDGIVANQTALNVRFDTGTLAHRVVSGLELTRERSENFNRAELGLEPPNTDLFDPNPADVYEGLIARTGAVTRGVARSVALYAFDTIDLNEKWEATGGLRWERFETDYSSFDDFGVETPFGRTDSMVSWRTGLVYKPRANGSIYIGAGNSFNPSAEGLSLATRGGSLADVEPETSYSYEVGTKWDVAHGRLFLTSALFQTEKTNARTAGLNPGDPPLVLQGRYRVRGVELGVVGNLTDAWNVFGGYTFMASQIEASNESDEIGNAFGNTPRHSFNLWTSLQLPWNVEIGGGAFYIGDRYNNDSGTRLAPGYWQLDAMAAVRLSDQLTLRLNAVNLANERFIDRVGGGHFIPGVGRSITITTVLGF